MAPVPTHLPSFDRTSPSRIRRLLVALLLLSSLAGCSEPSAIETYSIPTKMPEQLQLGKERMLAAMVPKGELVWFFKVSGPEAAMGEIESDLRQFVENIEFTDGIPDLTRLPQGWRQGSRESSQFRFATINIDTPAKQLELSVSNLSRQENWDEQVQMNVNRWRGQLKLPPSEQKWAEGESLEVAAADGNGVWVDLTGEASASGSMTPPFAGALAESAAGNTDRTASAVTPTATADEDTGSPSANNDSRLKFDRPEGWRDGRMTSMRMAAFNVGPEGASAELTVIPAGGDLRGNVARWLGQVRGGTVPDEVVDQAMAEAQQLQVDGRPAQRFFLRGEDAKSGEAIDATIIPLDNGMSLFVKMTGPAETVSQQADAIAAFLESLQLKL